MSDFRTAFNEGLDAAQKAEASRLEIDSVFEDLNQQLTEVSKGKLAIGRSEVQRTRSWMVQIAEALQSPEMYWVIIARNPTIEGSSSQQLCEWESGRAGYPCKLTWGGDEYYAEDKQALEHTLSNLLRDPIIAARLISLLDLKIERKQL